MRKVFFLFAILTLISCKKEEKSKSDEGPIVGKSTTEISKERDFPLKNLFKIEVLSYEDRMRWDRKITENDNKYTKDLVVNNKLNFDSTKVKERVLLNSVLKTELLVIMSQDSCKIEELPADCYMPRHMILFRDKKK